MVGELLEELLEELLLEELLKDLLLEELLEVVLATVEQSGAVHKHKLQRRQTLARMTTMMVSLPIDSCTLAPPLKPFFGPRSTRLTSFSQKVRVITRARVRQRVRLSSLCRLLANELV